MAQKQKKKTAPSTQKYVDIAAIRDGVVIMKNGSLRMVLMVSSVNFALKSEDEQEALISAYVRFLNGLEFPLQIVIQSRKLNIDDYLSRLIQAEKKQENELLRAQIADYRVFVKQMVELGDIMSKRFFVVVPLNPASAKKKKSFFSRAKDILAPAVSVRLKEKLFQKRKDEMQLRVDRVSAGLQGMSLQIVQLDTQSLIELYRNTYNPSLASIGELADLDKLQVEEDLYFIDE
jgi:23S rRNA G2069 N7-methylase RlmK/C1962 C5-methylase RlmI